MRSHIGDGLLHILKFGKIMELEFDKSDTNWNKEITSKEVFERTFDLGHLLLNHDHPILNHLKTFMFAKYKVVMKFKGNNPSTGIQCNGRTLVKRNAKFAPISLGKGVKIIEGTPFDGGGSNQYPIPTFKEGYCIIEFISTGLPKTEKYGGWNSEIIELTKID